MPILFQNPLNVLDHLFRFFYIGVIWSCNTVSLRAVFAAVHRYCSISHTTANSTGVSHAAAQCGCHRCCHLY